MKISAITLVRINNYGSLLQAYATQKTLEKLGHDVEFVDFVAANGDINQEVNQACEKRGLRPGLKQSLFRAVWKFNQTLQKRPFEQFVRSQINLSKPYTTSADLSNSPPIADIYLSGSDMLWSTKLNRGHEEKQFYLDYAPEGKKRVAFSASIGEDTLPDEEEAFLRKMLIAYSSISMREWSGVKLLQSIGIEASKVLDPTLMLNANEWNQVADDFRPKKPYLLVYFLHNHPEVLCAAKKYAHEKGFEMIRVAFNPFKRAGDDKIYFMPNISRFLSLFREASCVVTDSFHGTCFSINYSRDFFVTHPPRFMSRLSDILGATGTTDRLLENSNIDFESAKPIHPDKVGSYLEEGRAAGRQFLLDSLV